MGSYIVMCFRGGYYHARWYLGIVEVAPYDRVVAAEIGPRRPPLMTTKLQGCIRRRNHVDNTKLYLQVGHLKGYTKHTTLSDMSP